MATCKDCAHVEVCGKRIMWQKFPELCNVENLATCCDFFTDRSRFVELPCKFGDDMYCIYHGKIERSGVTSICIGSPNTGIVIYTVQFSFTAEHIGKYIFFSEEEAEQALNERKETSGDSPGGEG